MIIVTSCSASMIGLSIVAFESSMARITIMELKSAFIWLFFLLYPGSGHETFKWLEFLGFVILMIGAFIFNRVFINWDISFVPGTWRAKMSVKFKQPVPAKQDTLIPARENDPLKNS